MTVIASAPLQKEQYLDQNISINVFTTYPHSYLGVHRGTELHLAFAYPRYRPYCLHSR